MDTNSDALLLLEHTVPEMDDGTTVSHILRGRMKLSQRLYRRLKRENGVFLNGVSVLVNHIVRTGDRICLYTTPEGSSDTIPEDIPLNILFEDEDVVILDKPPGICVHPTHGHWTGTLANGLAQYFIDTGIRTRMRPVHRLDMDTSGLVAFAKNQLSHQRLAVQLDSRTMSRRYEAIALGWMDEAEGTLWGAIARNPDNYVERMVTEEGGREAVTYYVEMGRYPLASRLSLTLGTGRTHQIRVHLAHSGHPLIGDPLYMKEQAEGKALPEWLTDFPRQALHAAELSFDHPRSGERVTFHSPLPADLKELIGRLEALGALGPDPAAAPGSGIGSE